LRTERDDEALVPFFETAPMSTIEEAPDAELIDLVPTEGPVQSDPWSAVLSAARSPGPAVAMADDGAASLSGDVESLRRRRLIAAALVLSVICGVLLAWNLATEWTQPTVWILMSLRFALASMVFGLLVSPLGASAWRVRALEFALFGGLMALLFAAQYFENLELMRRLDVPGMVERSKNGVIQAVLTMMVFGTFIPHRPKTVAWATLGMALTPLLSFAVLTENADVAAVVATSQSSFTIADDAVYLFVGAGVAVFASAVVNSLRSELHEARKFGQYRLIRQLGSGGMGEVYLAEHALLKRPCALKLIKPEAGASPLALARFEREVQSSARLAHHNTIAIYDYGRTEDGTFYYVMEYLDGMNLAELLERYGWLPAGRVIYLFRQVCAGLAEAHALGLVHRDLKPANIFVSRVGGESDVAKVLDFGLVKVTEETGAVALTRDMTISGTPLYMSPEQAAADRSLDARADIYALGAVMYHALTGRPPFVGDSPFSVMMAHSRDDIVPLRKLRPDIPGDLEAVVLLCLAKKPADRYPTVTALNRALAACGAEADWGPSRADAWWEAIAQVGRPDGIPNREQASEPSHN
jgi:eukaryotic-like serine/threonine-protein kinase